MGRFLGHPHPQKILFVTSAGTKGGIRNGQENTDHQKLKEGVIFQLV